MKVKKVILITGASSGIGKEAALKLISEGHIVYGAARRTEKMQSLVDSGGFAIEMDMTDENSIKDGISQIVKEQKRIDILWNNAGYALYGSIEDTTLEDARRQFEVNIFGLASITKEVLPVMRKQRSGLIINTSSMGGKVYTPLGAWYHASKHALEGWSDCLRLETKQFGIDVVILEPGIIRTEFGDVMLKPMVERSGEGPYSKMAKSIEKSTLNTYTKPSFSSPPSVIAETVSKIVNARKPRIRYVKGKMAKPSMLIRRWFGDRFYDRMVLSMIKT